MDNVNLKGTDLTVSRLCFGTMTFGGQVDAAGSQAMVDRCLEAGINFFDTANVYTQGASETILGQVLKGRRKQVVLASKVGMTGPEVPAERRLSKESMRQGIEDSLRRLQTDYLDLYYLHRPDYSVPIEETLETMDEFVKQGKVRYPACSNYASWQITRMAWLADKAGYRPVRLAQQMHNLLARGLGAGIRSDGAGVWGLHGCLQPACRRIADGQAPARAAYCRHAVRRQHDVPRSLLASGVFRCRGRTAYGGSPGRPVDGEPCHQLVADPENRRWCHSRSFQPSATGSEFESG